MWEKQYLLLFMLSSIGILQDRVPIQKVEKRFIICNYILHSGVLETDDNSAFTCVARTEGTLVLLPNPQDFAVEGQALGSQAFTYVQLRPRADAGGDQIVF